MTVCCPICKNEVDLKDKLAPFCSERCKLIDLGNWASGKYVISRPAEREELEHGSRNQEDDFPEGTSKLVH